MKAAALLIAAALGALAFAPAALAQPAAPPAVSPAQIDAAETTFQQGARAAFQTARRTPAQRQLVVHVVANIPAGTSVEFGPTTTLTPQAPYAAEKAWLNTTLASVDAGDGTITMMAYADDYAPAGSLDVVIKTAPGKRYLVECGVLTRGAPAVWGAVFSGVANAITQKLQSISYGSSTPGSVASVVTPASTAEYLRVSITIPRGAIGSGGQAVLVADKCEVTPFS